MAAKRKTTKRRPKVLDVSDPVVLLTALERQREALSALGGRVAELERILEDLVTEHNADVARKEAEAAAAAARTSTSTPAADVVQVVPVTPAPSKPATPAARSAMLQALIAKRPELAARLQALPACAAHSAFTFNCAECRSGALAKLGGMGALAGALS